MAKNIDAKTLRSCRMAMAAAGVSLGLASLPNPALAVDTQLAWQGIVTTTGSTTQCQGFFGGNVGDAQVSIYRPKIATTDTATFFSLVFVRSAITFENENETTVHQMHGAGNYEGFGVNTRAKFFDYTGTYSFTVTPATIVASTPVVTITGKIDNYLDVAGCNITFTGVYGPRLD